MSNNPMTLAQFTERYFPDYEEKKRKLNVLKSEANTPKYSMERGEICRQKKNLSASMFVEALEEFHRKAFMSGYNANHDEVMTLRNDIWREACEAQREECVTHYSKVCGHSDYSATTIRNSPIAEPPKNERK